MKLILVRHGNTFESTDEVVMAGATEDLPLVTRGREQAVSVAKFIKRIMIEQEIVPEKIIAANLKRTEETAEIIAQELVIPLVFTPRLNEIDYGEWAGKTNQQIIDTGGGQALNLWNTESVWPEEFKTSYKQLTENLDTIVNSEAADSTVIIVSSNGILRYFLRYIAGEFEERISRQDFRMKTGHVSLLEIGDDPQVYFWNINPEDYLNNSDSEEDNEESY